VSSNKKFFEHKRPWSRVKDELLRCYLSPYLNKIITTNNPTLYIDCFAGKGKFDDGEDGSPITALNCVRDSIERYKNAHLSFHQPTIHVRFIELHFAKELENNIPQEYRDHCKVICGKYEDEIVPLLNSAIKRYNGRLNVFLYVDPYGIKALNAKLFCQLPEVVNTAELLINLNSVGFIREALRVRKIALKENEAELLSDLEEFDTSGLNSIQELNNVAGGEYWQPIVDDYKLGRIDFYEAEKRFSAGYKEMLRAAYKYVLDMPIRIKADKNPKYRMVHATNHPQGCILMADNVFRRTDHLIVSIQRMGQMSLFEQSADNELVDISHLEEKMCMYFADLPKKWIKLSDIQAGFFNEHGVICSSRHLSSASDSVLKRMEKKGIIEVRRTENGVKKESRAWTESRHLAIEIRKK